MTQQNHRGRLSLFARYQSQGKRATRISSFISSLFHCYCIMSSTSLSSPSHRSRLQRFREADVHLGKATYSPEMRPFLRGQGYSSGVQHHRAQSLGLKPELAPERTMGEKKRTSPSSLIHQGKERSVDHYGDYVRSHTGSSAGGDGRGVSAYEVNSTQTLDRRKRSSFASSSSPFSRGTSQGSKAKKRQAMKESSLRIEQRVSMKHPETVWRMDPMQSILHWQQCRQAIDQVIQKDQSILIVATSPESSSLARGVRKPFLKEVNVDMDSDSSEGLEGSRVHLLTMNWIYGRLTNFSQLREMAMTYQVTPPHEMSYADHLRYALYRRSLEPRRLRGKRPGMVFFLNAGQHKIAVREAHHMGIPVAGVVNTDFQHGEWMDYLIPGNDQSQRAHLRYLTLRASQLKESLERHKHMHETRRHSAPQSHSLRYGQGANNGTPLKSR